MTFIIDRKFDKTDNVSCFIRERKERELPQWCAEADISESH